MADVENWSKLRRYSNVMELFGQRAESWLVRYGHMFEGLDLQGKTVLDVGAGCGWASFYAAALGAKWIVMVEPEAEGSRNTMLNTAREIREILSLEDVIEIVPTTLEEADLDDGLFDITIIDNAINHIDEEATVAMHTNWDARKVFWPLLRKIRNATTENGILVVTDASSRNFFGNRGWKAPLAPTIEWHKHQPPETWAKLLAEIGFSNPRIDWTPVPRLGAVGRLLARSEFGSYFTNSHFRLIVQKTLLGRISERGSVQVVEEHGLTGSM